MVTTLIKDTGGTLTASFYQFPGGGPLVNLDATPTITISSLTTGPVLGPTSVGVGHPATGVYTFPWTAPVPLGGYIAVWDGLFTGDPVQASEEFVVITSSPQSAGACGPWDPIWCVDIPIGGAAISGWALQAATDILWAKSGRQFDSCAVTLRPCRKDCWGSAEWPWTRTWNEFGTSWPYPYNYAGQWFNLGCGGCPGSCSCTVLRTAELPNPTTDVLSVKVDGVLLDPSAYRVYDHRTLLRVDGGDWPICNDLNKDTTEVGTWEVVVRVGTEVPVLGRMAVAELARELILACVDSAACKLPRPVQQITRQGVTMTFLDPNVVFADGKIGLQRSDLFISTFNPQGIQQRAQAIDVDALGPVTQTWP